MMLSDIIVTLTGQLDSGVRGRYSSDRGICLEHEFLEKNCKVCNNHKVRKSDAIVKRDSTKTLYRFKVKNPSRVPILFTALCIDDKDDNDHHAYFFNGPGVFDRSGVATGILKFDNDVEFCVEHDNHEVLVVKQEGVELSFYFRRQFITHLMDVFDQSDVCYQTFNYINQLHYPCNGSRNRAPSSSLRIFFTFTPLIGDQLLDRIVKVSAPIAYKNRPKKSDVSGSASCRSRHNSMVSIASSTARECAATWLFPTSVCHLADLVRDVRSDFMIARPLDISLPLGSNVRKLLRKRVEQKILVNTTPVCTYQLDDDGLELPGTFEIERYLADPSLEMSAVALSETDFLESFEPQESAAGLINPPQNVMESICEGLCSFKSEPAFTLQRMNEAIEMDIDDENYVQILLNTSILNANQADPQVSRFSQPEPVSADEKQSYVKFSGYKAMLASDDDYEDLMNNASSSQPAEHNEDGNSLSDVDPFNPERDMLF